MRWIILFAAVIMQMALGGVYAWSAFVPALRERYELLGWQAGFIFGTTIAVFTVSMLFAGRRLERIGPTRMALTGALLYGGGYLWAGYSGGSWLALWAAIGVLGGAGIGMGYVCPLTTCVRWFPRQKGLVTGIAVAGFGAGAILLAEGAEGLLSAGWSPLRIFRILGWTFTVLVGLCALVMRFPVVPPNAHTSPHPVSSIGGKHFYGLLAGMFGGTFGGLLVIGHLKPIALEFGLSSHAGALTVSALAIGNTLGRILWGHWYDRRGEVVIPVSMVFLTVSLMGLWWSGSAGWTMGVATCIGFGFGACFVVYAAEIAAVYGVDRVASLYPKVFLAYGFAGITGPLLGGALYDVSGFYTAPIAAAVIISGLGALATWRWVFRRHRMGAACSP